MQLPKISVVLLALLLAAMAIVPCVSAVENPLSSDKNQEFFQLPREAEPIQPPGIGVSDDEIREMIDVTIKAIITSDLDEKIKDQNVKRLSQFLTSDTPVNQVELQKVMIEMGPDCLDKISLSPTPKWAGFIHNDMALIAGQKMAVTCSLSSSEITSLGNNAEVPDTWGSANHYKINGATANAESYANTARGYYQNGDTVNGALNLAYSLHFMTDMSMPFHWGPSALPAHEQYEIYLSNHWTSGDSDEQYRNVVSGNNYYYTVTDVSDSADNLIAITNWYQPYLENQINTNPDWQADSTVRSYTRDSLLYGARFNMGLIDYVK
jgi:hypothetical protein